MHWYGTQIGMEKSVNAIKANSALLRDVDYESKASGW